MYYFGGFDKSHRTRSDKQQGMSDALSTPIFGSNDIICAQHTLFLTFCLQLLFYGFFISFVSFFL